MKECLTGYTRAQLTQCMEEIGEPGYRGDQLYAWLHKGAEFDQMRNLPKGLLQRLAGDYAAQGARIVKTLRSEKDGTEKYLFSLTDGNVVEGVLMRYRYGNTLCISSQVGCRMGCAFCASTLNGRVRNLSAGEMLSQVAVVNRLHAQGEHRGVTNVVMMGSGEPLDNYEQTLRFLHLLSAPDGLAISLRNVSLSTCGLIEGIRRLAGEKLPVTLSLSLHGADDATRRRLIPAAASNPLPELMRACRDYVAATSRRMVLEYALIEGVNCALEDADRLAALAKGLLCHVNLIPLNPVAERSLRPPKPGVMEAFQKRLEQRGVSVTRRREMGADIQGACGQLRRSYLEGENHADAQL